MDLSKVYHIINFYDDSDTSKEFNVAYEKLAEEWTTLAS